MQFSTLVILAATLLSAFDAHPAPTPQVDLERRGVVDLLKKWLPTSQKVQLPTEQEVIDAGFDAQQHVPDIVRGTTKIGPWYLLGTLGSGTFGFVSLGWNGTTYAMLKHATTSLSNPEMELDMHPSLVAAYKSSKPDTAIDTAIDIQSSLKGLENVVQIWDIIKQDNKRFIVMEPTNAGKLSSYHVDQKYDGLPEPVAKPIFRQLVKGLMAVHAKDIAIRNIKPTNILLFKTGNQIVPKYYDFGISSKSSPDAKGWKGTSFYLPPEAFTQDTYNLAKADVYALGITLFNMLTGNWIPRLMIMEDGKKKYEPIDESNGVYADFMKNHPQAHELVKHMTDTDPKARWTLDKVLQDKWLTSE